MNLVIVESPAKAKTIEKFLGPGHKVLASYGHLRDLPKSGIGVDVEHDFRPEYIVPDDSKKQVALLKKEMLSADTIYLATDLDREGEAISWHVACLITEDIKISKDKKESTEKKFKRIEFNEITKEAILHAVANPREIDQNLVNAQQARRVLDRLVGYELSPVLWKKVKPSLSAGRVQSVLVRLVVEREREIMDFKPIPVYKVSGIFLTQSDAILKAELGKKFNTKEEATKFLEKCKNADFQVSNIETKPAKKSPSAPFTTSTLQQEASRKYGFGVSQTMQIAQKLYEKGAITYMRTDSVNLSDEAIRQATATIKKMYGDRYLTVRRYKTKSKGAQEAHEAIRPTHFDQQSMDGDYQEAKLYNLIWKRAIASQMSEAELEKTSVTIGVSTAEEKFVALGEVLKFDGFLKAYLESKEPASTNASLDKPERASQGGEKEEERENFGILPKVTVGDKLTSEEISATEKFSRASARYTEASLVKKMEELGIGRPSTYAPTISTVQKRGYVLKRDREGTPQNFVSIVLKNGIINEEIQTENTGIEKNKLFPTDIGMIVTDFLLLNFKEIMDYSFTAKVENEFDEVAKGKLLWTKMLHKFYNPFHKTVEQVTKESERAVGERLLGKDPKSGRDVVARLGRFGPLVQIGRKDEEEKQIFAAIKVGQRLENITFEEAIDLFKLPRNLGEYKGGEVVVANGRYGPYIKYKDEFISLPKTEDPYTISLERAREIISGPRLPRELGEYEGKKLSVAKGIYGPYIKYEGTFASLPKSLDPFEVNLEEAIEILKVKMKKDAEKLIKNWDEDRRVKVVNGRYGPAIQSGRKMFKIPADKKPEELTLEEALEVAGLSKPKAKKKTKKK